ncbi:photosystem II assembly protein Psb34 [Hyella patelloides]
MGHHISDGSELIPAEIPTGKREGINKRQNKSLEVCYTVDDEGIINNYATEPSMFLANCPSPEQQKRYVFLGAGAMLLVVTTLLTAFTVS